MKSKSMLLLAGLGALVASAPLSAIVINTNPANSSVNTFSSIGTETYGQTFSVPVVDNTLSSFAVTLNTTGTVSFNFYVMAWDVATSRTTGAVLFSQGFTNSGSNTISIAPGLSLTSGSDYVAFLSTLGVTNSLSNGSSMDSRSDNAYAGGSFVFNNNNGPFSNLSSTAWEVGFGSAADLAFRAEFTSGGGNRVPDQGSVIVMLAGGLMGLMAFGRRFRTR